MGSLTHLCSITFYSATVCSMIRVCDASPFPARTRRRIRLGFNQARYALSTRYAKSALHEAVALAER
jgi:hypothetical protein